MGCSDCNIGVVIVMVGFDRGSLGFIRSDRSRGCRGCRKWLVGLR